MAYKATPPSSKRSPEQVRLTYQGVKVLQVFLQVFSLNVRNELAGIDVMKNTGLSAGTLYPLLLRFERAGILASRWEEEPAATLGRPRRRLYKLTGAGEAFTRKELSKFVIGLNPLTTEA